MSQISSERIQILNDCNIATEGDYVLYWMVAARRLHYNASLQRAVELAQELEKPLLVFEAISTRHKYASDRIVTFMVQGMIENIQQFESHNIHATM